MSGTQVAIDIEDDGSAKIVEIPVGDAAAAQPAVVLQSDDPNVGVDDLRRQLSSREDELRAANNRTADEQRRTADAERRARESSAEAIRLAAEHDNTQYTMVVNSLAANESEMVALQRQKAEALEKGEYAQSTVFDAQMARVGARIESLTNGKQAIEEQRLKTPKVEPQQQQQQVSQAEANERWLATMLPKSQAWIRQHMEFFSDESFRERVLAAATHAEKIKGYTANDDEYFRAIEADLGIGQQQQQQNNGAQQHQSTVAHPTSQAGVVQDRQSAAPTRAATPSPAAAPSRSAPDLGGGQREPSKRIVLTPEQREMAAILHPKRLPTDPDPEVTYAKNLYALQKEGRVNY